MATKQRTKKSTPANRVKTFSESVDSVDIPFDLDDEELDRFRATIGSKEISTWNDAATFQAGMLAKEQVLQLRLFKEIDEEGTVIKTDKGTPIRNPKYDVYNTVSRLSLSRIDKLGLSATQRGVSGKKQEVRDQKSTTSRKKLASVSSLIAKP